MYFIFIFYSILFYPKCIFCLLYSILYQVFKYLQDRESSDSLDSLYSCIWDMTILEFAMSLHTRLDYWLVGWLIVTGVWPYDWLIDWFIDWLDMGYDHWPLVCYEPSFIQCWFIVFNILFLRLKLNMGYDHSRVSYELAVCIQGLLMLLNTLFHLLIGDWFISWLNDWLVDWLHVCLLIDWLIACLFIWLIV